MIEKDRKELKGILKDFICKVLIHQFNFAISDKEKWVLRKIDELESAIIEAGWVKKSEIEIDEKKLVTQIHVYLYGSVFNGYTQKERGLAHYLAVHVKELLK